MFRNPVGLTHDIKEILCLWLRVSSKILQNRARVKIENVEDVHFRFCFVLHQVVR